MARGDVHSFTAALAYNTIASIIGGSGVNIMVTGMSAGYQSSNDPNWLLLGTSNTIHHAGVVGSTSRTIGALQALPFGGGGSKLLVTPTYPLKFKNSSYNAAFNYFISCVEV